MTRRGLVPRLALVVVVVALAAGPAAGDRRRSHRSRRPAPGTVVTAADLGWPTTTASIALRSAAKIYRKLGGHGRLGKIAAGTRVGYRSLVAGRGACRVWIELEPAGAGWLCGSDARPSDQPPLAVAHPIDRVPRRSEGIHNQPSTFAGLRVADAPPPQWPFAWIVPRRHGRRIAILDAPRGSEVATGEARTIVPVLAERDGFVQIGAAPDRWVDAEVARIARLTTAPSGVGAGERWIDVDLDQQVLVAYDGATPSFVTLVSSGHHTSGTPTGVHRIQVKTARTTMRNPEGTALAWHVRDVPWAMTYRKNFAVHGVYWHDGFGRKQSHGCVNLAPSDARWVWDWTLPAVPEGWIEVKADAGTGTAIRLRNHNHPDPPWLDFAGETPTASRGARRHRGR